MIEPFDVDDPSAGTILARKELLKAHDRYSKIFALSATISLIFAAGVSLGQMRWTATSSVMLGCAALTSGGALYHYFTRKKELNKIGLTDDSDVQWNPRTLFSYKKA